MTSSHFVTCGFAICLIMLSTASVATKLLFGVKPGRFCLRSTIWTAVNHRRECGVFALAVNEYSQASGAKSVEAAISVRHYFCAYFTTSRVSDWSVKTRLETQVERTLN